MHDFAIRGDWRDFQENTFLRGLFLVDVGLKLISGAQNGSVSGANECGNR